MPAPLLVGIPAGPNVPTPFQSTWWTLRVPPGGVRVIEGEGPYAAMNMRNIVAAALKDPTWERFLCLETDMLPEPDMLLRHAAHTAPVVGSVYFQHYPPYDLVATVPGSRADLHRRLTPEEVRTALWQGGEGLLPVKSVGLGCTSIARSVFESWPKGVPFFRNEWTDAPHIQANSAGEISHDAWFCEQLEAQGIPIALDVGCRLGHLSHSAVTMATHASFHAYPLKPPSHEDLVEEVPLRPA